MSHRSEEEYRITPRRSMSPVAGLLGAVGCCAVVLLLVGLGGSLYFARSNYPLQRNALCLSNAKQLGIAAMMYAQDYDNHLPIAARWQADLSPYIRDASVVRCPARPYLPSGYAYNALLSGFSTEKLTSTAAAPLLFESSLGLPNGSDRLESFVAPHNGSGYVTYADGHSKATTSAPKATAGLPKKPSATRRKASSLGRNR